MVFFFLFSIFLKIVLLNNNVVFCQRTEIQFNIVNVPSLFRCKKDGPIFRFEKFPTYREFSIATSTSTDACDLILNSNDQQVFLQVQQLSLECLINVESDIKVNEYLFFRYHCSNIEICQSLPTVVSIITDYKHGYKPTQFHLQVHRTDNFGMMIGDHGYNMYSWKQDVYSMGENRTSQIIFQNSQNRIFNMMCEYSYMNDPSKISSVCHTKSGLSTVTWSEIREYSAEPKITGWSWICYYYPEGSENPLDHTMVNRAVNDFNQKRHSIPNNNRQLNSDDNPSKPSLPTNITSLSSDTKNTQSSTNMIVIMIILSVLLSICGMCYMFKKESTRTARDIDVKLSVIQTSPED